MPVVKTPTAATSSPYDVVVDAGGDGDYTTIKAAFDGEGADNSYLIKAGSYTESDEAIVPSGAEVKFGADSGGVVTNKQITTGATLGTEGGATIAAAVVTVGAGIDLSDVEANAGDYTLFFRGVEYAVSSADDAAHTITLSTSPPNPAGGGNDMVWWAKSPARNVKMSGLVTISVIEEMYGFVDCNFSDLVMRSQVVKMLYGCRVTYPRSYTSGGDVVAAAQSRSVLVGSNSDCIWPLVSVSAGNPANASNYTGIEFCPGGDFFVDNCIMTANVRDCKNSGAGAYTGMACADAARIKDTTIMGLSMDCDTNATNLTNANTAALKVS